MEYQVHLHVYAMQHAMPGSQEDLFFVTVSQNITPFCKLDMSHSFYREEIKCNIKMADYNTMYFQFTVETEILVAWLDISFKT